MTILATTTDIQDEDGLFDEFPQIRAALPAWASAVHMLEYDDVEKLTRFVISNDLAALVTLWSSGEVRADGTVHTDDGLDILFGKSGEIDTDSPTDAIETARSIGTALRSAITLISADFESYDAGPAVEDVIEFADFLGVDAGDLLIAISPLLLAKRERTLRRNLDVTAELAGRDV